VRAFSVPGVWLSEVEGACCYRRINCQLARIDQTPFVTHVHLLPSDHTSGGVGEPGVPPIVAAITNAVFAATGKRVRDLPISKTKLV
jgi:isoquinoline 1-oxidoreductase beta subunit